MGDTYNKLVDYMIMWNLFSQNHCFYAHDFYMTKYTHVKMCCTKIIVMPMWKMEKCYAHISSFCPWSLDAGFSVVGVLQLWDFDEFSTL